MFIVGLKQDNFLAPVLCILTSEWVLCTPFAGHLFLRKNKFFHLFSVTNGKKKEKRKESIKNKEKHAKRKITFFPGVN